MELTVGEVRGVKAIPSERGMFTIGAAATRWREVRP
jgi:hypothetical protein